MKPIKPIRSFKKPGQLNQAELYVQVKDSTERNRQFFFIWITFALYVIVTTVATTDLQLLLPNSTVTLPALGIQLPLIGFFLVTPWLVLILHFNLLQNLDSHSNKLLEWANTYPNQVPPRAALPAFRFDFAMLEHGGVYIKLTQIATQLVFYAAGPITIGILLWRFSDYQSWPYTILQLLAFIFNCYLVLRAILALNQNNRFKVAISEFNYWTVYVPIIGAVIFQTYFVVVLALQIDRPTLDVYPKIWRPIISLQPYTETLKLRGDTQARMALDGETNLVEWLKTHGIGLDLSNRNLILAELPGIDLRQAMLYGTRFDGANLMGVYLQKNQLNGQQLQKVNLNNAHLEEVNLQKANLQEASLIYASLEGADLRMSNLKQANLTGISVNNKTNFVGSVTDFKTEVLVYDVEYMREDLTGVMSINLAKTIELRKQLRDNNGLILPDILYKQLFAFPKDYPVRNNEGKVDFVKNVGLFEAVIK